VATITAQCGSKTAKCVVIVDPDTDYECVALVSGMLENSVVTATNAWDWGENDIVVPMDGKGVTIKANEGYIIKKVTTTKGKTYGLNFNDSQLSAAPGKLVFDGDTANVTDIDSDTFNFKAVNYVSLGTIIVYYEQVHSHDFTYSASGATLTATCGNADCDLQDSKVSLTLTASSANYSGSAVEASMDKTAWEAAGLTAPTIVYEAKTGSALTDNKAVNVGSYTAKITAGDPAVTASVDFDIHGASTTYDSDDTNHWFTCALSGCTNTDETHKFNKATHSYDGTTHKCACGKIDPTYHQHVLGQKHDAVAGNCVDKGTVEYYDCAGTVGGACGKYLDAEGHELASIEGTTDATNHKGTATTWTKTATTHKETYDCCGAVKTAEADHTGGTATCQAKAKCSVCEMEYGDLANHAFATEFTEDTAATCTEKGSKSKHCTTTGCTETTEVTDIDPLGHTGGTATCQAKAVCTRCTKEYGDLANHAFATEFTEDTPATCTEKGSKSKHCTTTGCTETTEVTDIEPLGHTGGTATCQAKAICTRCTKEYGDLANHAFATEFTEDTPATCTEAGSKSKHCTTAACTEKTDVTPITALGHKEIAIKAVAATCTEAGLTEGKKCSVCGTVTVAQNKVEALGHKYDKPVFTWTGYTKATAKFTCANDSKHVVEKNAKITSKVTKAATTTATGIKTYTATVTYNNKTYTSTKKETIAKLKSAANELALDSKFSVNTGKNITVTWGKVKEATGYDVYMAYCGKDKMAVVKTASATATKATITKLNKKAIDQEKHVKCYVVAFKKVGGKKVTLAKTIVAHAVGNANKTATDAKKIKLTKTSITVAKGKTAKIKATTVKHNKKLPILTHTSEFRYSTSDSNIATVSKDGKVTAKKKGSCYVYVYVYAVNGCAKKVKVTVK